MCKTSSPSKPELEGWIDREKLLDISGRSRNRQLELAREIGLENFESPGGGCLLTEIQFSHKLRDFTEHDKLEIEDIDTLKAGRHLRLPDGAKLIIGRDKDDNEKLKNTNSSKYLKARIIDATGPFVLFQKDASEQDKELAAKLIITYGRTQPDTEYEVQFNDNDNVEQFILKNVKFPDKKEAAKYMI